MQNVKAPDNNAEQIINRMINDWQIPLLHTCCILLGDAEQARDAVQETFIKAWHALPDFRGECSEKTWLMRIAINTCHDIKRSMWFRFVDRRITPDDLPEPTCNPWNEDKSIFDEVCSLPVKQREVILLYYYHNMTVSDIAETLNISQPSVSKRLKKAKQNLKTLLKEEAT